MAKKMIIPIVYVVIMMVLGIIGNALVLYIYGFKWRRTPEKCFITTLALFDLVNCVITMPTEIATLVSFYRFTSHSFCKFSRFFTFWMNNSSVVLLFAIAVDRFIKICLPNKMSFNYHKAKITCVCSTVIGLVESWPSLIRIWLQKSKGDKRKDSLKASLRSSKSGSQSHEKEVSLLSIKPKVEMENTQSVELSDDAFDSGSSEEPKRDGVVIKPPVNPEPKTSARSRLKSMTSVHISKSGLQAGKATAMLFAITMVYIISFLPYLVITIMRTAYGDTWYPSLSLSSQVAVNLFLTSYLISNTGNAIVYGFCNLTFQRECAKIFTRLFCCKKN
ncbi:putative trace amine-associated receptor 3 [Patella vulgata]|uniref:putative trace amine-associated receptor 3 n=1 Tax=Patella vulgata TaxID=6465 RepID=UPI0024A7D7C7|nr:putative trace amine-associated receptor 3 [Patella vulgata]